MLMEILVRDERVEQECGQMKREEAVETAGIWSRFRNRAKQQILIADRSLGSAIGNVTY